MLAVYLINHMPIVWWERAISSHNTCMCSTHVPTPQVLPFKYIHGHSLSFSSLSSVGLTSPVVFLLLKSNSLAIMVYIAKAVGEYSHTDLNSRKSVIDSCSLQFFLVGWQLVFIVWLGFCLLWCNDTGILPWKSGVVTCRVYTRPFWEELCEKRKGIPFQTKLFTHFTQNLLYCNHRYLWYCRIHLHY